MATAVYSYSNLLRQQIEGTLAAKGGARLALTPRLVREGHATGYETLDSVLRGGIPVAGTTEIVGSRSSGRATIAAAYLAERTREGLVCAWVDVAGEMSPEAAAADGVDLDRVLWVRCSVPEDKRTNIEITEVPQRRAQRADVVRLGDTQAGLQLVQVSPDRMPKRRGEVVLRRRDQTVAEPMKLASVVPAKGFAKKRVWGPLEQGVKAVDLLVQGGGFGAIVLDLGGVGAEVARKIPLATWFRWRAALERTRTSLVVLSPYAGRAAQLGCAGSSAELVLRVEAEIPAAGTVMLGGRYRLEVVRRRFDESDVGRKKQPGRDFGRVMGWQSRAAGVAS
jgi:hypothetical protein